MEFRHLLVVTSLQRTSVWHLETWPQVNLEKLMSDDDMKGQNGGRPQCSAIQALKDPNEWNAIIGFDDGSIKAIKSSRGQNSVQDYFDSEETFRINAICPDQNMRYAAFGASKPWTMVTAALTNGQYVVGDVEGFLHLKGESLI